MGFVFFLRYNRITSFFNCGMKDTVMKTTPSRTLFLTGILLSCFVFAFLLMFTYGLLFMAPYPGFYFNPTDGTILSIYEDLTPVSAPHLVVGDVLKRVGSATFEDYQNSATLNLFSNIQQGEEIEITVLRDGREMTVSWVYPGLNDSEFISRFFNVWWVAYIFWFFGMSTQLFMRPKDKRWGLFIASNYLTGMFIMLGSVSSYQILWSPILLRVVAWLILPVYLHFHWIFPRSLHRIPRWLQFVFYTACGLTAVRELLAASPGSSYFLAVALAFLGSVLLLVAHFVLQPDHRRDVSILAIAALLSMSFAIFVSVIGSSGRTPHMGPLSILSLPILPGAYFYILYRRNLGGLELRTNRAISIYLFLILLGVILLLFVGFLRYVNVSREAAVFINITITLLAVFVSILVFPSFQSFVERRILGIKLPSQSLAESYSARIITSDTLSGLLKLLRDEVFPSLLIRQYAFVRNPDASVQVMLLENVTQHQVREDALRELFASLSTGQLSPSFKINSPLDWVHLTLPLQFGPDLIGVWLLGRRDPDDLYPQAELPILQSLANQTAVALSNIIQTERLKAMYEANINRYEQERLRLAHDLHDSVLNEMAAILIKNDSLSLSPEFQKSYGGVISRVREIVSDFRPPILNYGLKFALDGLVDNLSERNQDKVLIVSDIRTDGEWKYPEVVEHNLCRIVQEACENALKYSRARSITITGELSAGTIDIMVTDDGVGFNIENDLKLDDMLANKHYGLAGMHERASLIGAAIRFDSKPEQGTRINVLWTVKQMV